MLPASNSIHTPAPFGGIVQTPTPLPAYGAAGSAQPLATSVEHGRHLGPDAPLVVGVVVVGDRPAELAVLASRIRPFTAGCGGAVWS